MENTTRDVMLCVVRNDVSMIRCTKRSKRLKKKDGCTYIISTKKAIEENPGKTTLQG